MKSPLDLDSMMTLSKNLVFNTNRYIVDSKPLSDEEFKLSLKADNTSVSVDLVEKDISFNSKKYL